MERESVDCVQGSVGKIVSTGRSEMRFCLLTEKEIGVPSAKGRNFPKKNTVAKGLLNYKTPLPKTTTRLESPMARSTDGRRWCQARARSKERNAMTSDGAVP